MGLPSLTQSNTLPPVTSDSISTSTDQRGTCRSFGELYVSFQRISWKQILINWLIEKTIGFMSNLTTPSAGNLPPTSINPSANVTTPITSNINTTNNNNNNSNNNMNSSIQSTGNGMTTPNLSAGPFRPKPIEELLMPQHDKKTTPPSVPPPQMPMVDQKPNLPSAFNKSMDPNIKNTIAR